MKPEPRSQFTSSLIQRCPLLYNFYSEKRRWLIPQGSREEQKTGRRSAKQEGEIIFFKRNPFWQLDVNAFSEVLFCMSSQSKRPGAQFNVKSLSFAKMNVNITLPAFLPVNTNGITSPPNHPPPSRTLKQLNCLS